MKWNPEWPRWKGLRALDGGDLVRSLVLFAMAGGAFAISDLQNDSIVSGWPAWVGIIALALAAYIGVGFLLAKRIWDKTDKDTDPGTEEHPAFHLLFVILIAYLALLAWIGFGGEVPLLPWPWEVNLSHNLPRSLFFTAFAVGFAPLLYGYHLVASEARGEKMGYLIHPEGPVGWLTLGVGLAIVSALVFGAWAAGEKRFAMQGDFGLMVMGIVLMGFLFFVFTPHLVSFFNNRNSEPVDTSNTAQAGLTLHPGHLISSFDTLMVRLLAPLSGATLNGWLVPQLMLFLILLPISAMGFVLPAPWGLVPIALGGLIIFSLGRRWAWIEDDRETALRIQTTRSDRFRVGFANDLRDEALLGYAWLFILIPLALRQIEMQFHLFVPQTDEAAVAAAGTQATDFFNWLRFFGSELAKGVPLVDWVDIYDVDKVEVFSATSPAAHHLVFASRLLVDAVIIAALLQAFGIMQRNKAQKRLFEAGQIDFFDPFEERRLFRRAFRKPVKGSNKPLKGVWETFFEDHRSESAELGRGDYYYNTRRLNELRNNSDTRVKSVARWLSRDLIMGSVNERLRQIAERIGEADEETRAKPDWSGKTYHYIADVLKDARDAGPGKWRQDDSSALSHLLLLISEAHEYDNLRRMAFELLGSSGSLHAARALAARLVRPKDATAIYGMSGKRAVEWSFKRQNRMAERATAATELLRIRACFDDNPESDTFRFVESVRAYVLKDVGNDVREIMRGS